tara:strand:- start:7022 stop:7444 length:423 start_codon:yes stop_codon:yes gene_type:complete
MGDFKLLKAKKRVTCKDEPLVGVTPRVLEVPLENLMLTADNDWMMKRYPKFKKSIDRLGMMYPIIYTNMKYYWLVEKRWPKDTYSGIPIPGIAVHTGNKRVYWAKENGYTHIEGYYVKTKDEQAAIVRRTFMAPSSYGQN